MLFPHTAEYALRAVVHLARNTGVQYTGVAQISTATGVPENYLSKVLGRLVQASVLQSARGPAGGFRLVSDPGAITLAHVVAVFSPVVNPRCVLGHGICGSVPACPMHERWAPIAEQVQTFLRHTTIADLLRSHNPAESEVQRESQA